MLAQKESFLKEVDECGVEGVSREAVEGLIQRFQLSEYSIDSAEILLGLKKRIEYT